MLADRAHHDDAHARIFIQRLEHQPQLVALRHRDDVERWPVENDVGALTPLVDFDLKAVELGDHQIEDDGVVAPGAGFEEGFLAVGGLIDRVPFFAQRAGDDAEQLRLILDDQEAHGRYESTN